MYLDPSVTEHVLSCPEFGTNVRLRVEIFHRGAILSLLESSESAHIHPFFQAVIEFLNALDLCYEFNGRSLKVWGLNKPNLQIGLLIVRYHALSRACA